MIYQNDWVMRQIEMLGEFISRLVLKTDEKEYHVADYTNLTRLDENYLKIRALFNEKKFCQAEDFLFENLDENDLNYLRIANDFYASLNKTDDEVLKEYNFSKEEALEGLKEILKIYNVQTGIK